MIKFIEDIHKYIGIADGDTTWMSVTTLIHNYQPRKDWDEIRRRYAKKNKMSEDEVRALWEGENRKAIDRGTKFHKQRESELLSYHTIDVDGKRLPICRPSFEGGVKVAPRQNLSEAIYPELMVYLKSAKICGQADYVEIVNGSINIKDYKTNKKIETKGFTNWEGIEEMMTGPLAHIPNSNYWLYALQLNTYAYIIKKNNPRLKVGRLELLHISFDEDNEAAKVIPYILPDLQGSVKDMIEHYKINKK